MNSPDPDSELNALFARARAQRPDTSAAEYAFETRLMARLRTERESSVWAMVSWRLVPFLAVGVLGLAIWQVEFASETNDTATFASLDNPDAAEVLSNTTN